MNMYDVRDAIGNKPDIPMGDHFGNVHPDASDIPSCIDVSVLYRATDHPDRKIAESILIRKRRQELNSNVYRHGLSCKCMDVCHWM